MDIWILDNNWVIKQHAEQYLVSDPAGCGNGRVKVEMCTIIKNSCFLIYVKNKPKKNCVFSHLVCRIVTIRKKTLFLQSHQIRSVEIKFKNNLQETNSLTSLTDSSDLFPEDDR